MRGPHRKPWPLPPTLPGPSPARQVVESGADVVEVCELRYSKNTANPARWVLAVPEASPVQRAEDLAGTIVASELVNTTRRWRPGLGGGATSRAAGAGREQAAQGLAGSHRRHWVTGEQAGGKGRGFLA